MDVAWEVMESSRASESSSVALSLWCSSDHSEASQLRSSSFPNNAFDMDGKRVIAKIEKWPKLPNMYGSRQPPKGSSTGWCVAFLLYFRQCARHTRKDEPAKT